MATITHCLYCFEVLAATLGKREALSLAQVQKLWSRYNSKEKPTPAAEEAHHNEGNPSLMQDGFDDLPSNEVSAEEVDSDESPLEQPIPHSALRLPSISRLQNPSSSSSSSTTTSTSSTPTSLSANSSRAALSESSQSSSSSSFFSFSRSRRGAQPSSVPTAMARKEEEHENREHHPLFVTWNTVSRRSGHKSLRGCIGTFDPLELSNGLKSYALTAAFDDTRFSPISALELPSLSASVTLLTSFEPAADPFDWTLGIHGLRISFSHRGRRLTATYLPNVAVEQGWTKEETLVSLMRKAGWGGRTAEWRSVDSLRVVRYQGKKESVDYGVWKSWRDWVERSEEQK